jgi:hypothetical protein
MTAAARPLQEGSIMTTDSMLLIGVGILTLIMVLIVS